jgi:oligopeptide transport system ATP-binding protein
MPDVLEIVALKKYYPVRAGLFGGRWVHAVDGLSFSIKESETLGLVGESGSGKSTVAKCILGLEKPTEGRIILDGRDIVPLRFDGIRPLRKNMQMVFQDPADSLNPRLKIGVMVAEPLWLFGMHSPSDARLRAVELLSAVGLEATHAARYPHQLSGGQQQRVGIARAVAPQPRLVVLDEPTSALDVSVQAKLLNLLSHLQQELGLSFLFISHDLSVVSSLSSRVAVMYLGKIVEIGPTQQIFSEPLHPYTQALIAAIPISHPRQRRPRASLKGEIPSATDVPKGCRLVGRCPFEMPICSIREPTLAEVGSGRHVACYLYAEKPNADV